LKYATICQREQPLDTIIKDFGCLKLSYSLTLINTDTYENVSFLLDTFMVLLTSNSVSTRVRIYRRFYIIMF